METAAMTVRWKIEDVIAKLAAQKFETSPTFDDGRWWLDWYFEDGDEQEKRSEKYCSVYLQPVAPSHPDPAEEGGADSFSRAVVYDLKLETMTGKVIVTQTFQYTFDKSGVGYGTRDFVSHADISKHCKANEYIVLQCSLYTQRHASNPSIKPQETLHDSMKELFEDSSTDVVFRIRQDDSPSRDRVLFAHEQVLRSHSSYFVKLFGPGFLEGQASTSYSQVQDLISSATEPVEDDDDDSKEWLPVEDEDEDLPDAEPSTATTDSGSIADKGSLEGQGDGQGKAAEEAERKDRTLREVVITDVGFTTYRALLYWFYTHKPILTEVSSNYLVYLSSLNSAATTTPADEEQTQEASSASQSIKPRRKWLLERALRTECWDKEEDAIEPASPHALYRIADKLDIADLKTLLKATIVESFTVENILYELISTFSYHYTEMQDAALAFALLHWEKVKLTVAFQQVVTGSCMGKIEGASEIWMKLLMKLTTGGSTTEQKAPATPST